MSTAIAMPTPPATNTGLRLILKLVAALVAAAFVAAGAITLLNLMARHTFTVRSSYAGVRSLTVNSADGDVQLKRAPAGTELRTVEHVSEDLETPRRDAGLSGSGLLSLTGDGNEMTTFEVIVLFVIACVLGTALVLAIFQD